MRSSRVIPAIGAFGVAAFAFAAPPVFTGPQEYASIADSPYFGDGQSCFALEFFPGGMQSVPGLEITLNTGTEIVPAVGVPPGGYALQANEFGVITLSFSPPVNKAGFAWTGGASIGSTISLQVIAGTQAINKTYSGLPANNPDNPDDNKFFGVIWDVGIEQIQISFQTPFAINQIDQIQFELPPSDCQTGQPDFNGDGWNDLVVQNPVTSAVSIQTMLAGEAAGLVSINQPSAGVWNLEAVANFGSGTPLRPNILWRNSQTGKCAVWNMDGCARTGGYLILQNVSLAWSVVGCGDFNGDMVDDLVWQNEVDGTIVVWFMANGQRDSGAVFLSQAAPVWAAIGVGDFNGDGNPDIVWRNRNQFTIAIWFMGGTNNLQRDSGATVNQIASTDWNLVAVSDLDNDGDPDMVWQHIVTGAIAIWNMNGAVRESGYAPVLDAQPPSDWRVGG